MPVEKNDSELRANKNVIWDLFGSNTGITALSWNVSGTSQQTSIEITGNKKLTFKQAYMEYFCNSMVMEVYVYVFYFIYFLISVNWEDSYFTGKVG
jgi:hypothetical protein